jgi:acyl dehydratase
MIQDLVVAVGDELPSLVRTPGTEQLVRYAAAANDFAKIHYDADHARARGFEGVIVHGLLKAAYLGQVVTNWAGNSGRVRDFQVEYRKVDRPGDPITCRGRVMRVVRDDGVLAVHVELWTENSVGDKTTRGSAVVDFSAD